MDGIFRLTVFVLAVSWCTSKCIFHGFPQGKSIVSKIDVTSWHGIFSPANASSLTAYKLHTLQSIWPV